MLTILIPTKDRVDFVERALRFYDRPLPLPITVLIGDASNGRAAEEIERAVASCRHLKARYVRAECMSIARTIFELNALVETSYVTLIGDDDLLVPGGLKACVDALERDREAVAANGKAMMFVLKSGGPWGPFQATSAYPLRGILEKSAAHRLDDLLGSYFVNIFSVHRVEVWRSLWSVWPDGPNVAFAAELIPCALSAAAGRTRHLDDLYLLRQGHEKRYVLPDAFDRLNDPTWPEGFERFSHAVVSAVAKADDISSDKAREGVKTAFWGYVLKGMQKGYLARHPGGRMNGAKKVLGKCAWHLSNRMSLSRLLGPLNKYRREFRPVHDFIVTGGQNGKKI